MEKDIEIISAENIKNKIYTIRNIQVMIDSDLADLYCVETKNLNRAVKRNIERFPEFFRFQLTEDEFQNLKCQNGTSSQDKILKSQIADSRSTHGGRRYLPYAFTEQGVAMLSAVLRSKTAVKVSIQIMDAFVKMRKFLSVNASIFQRLDRVEQKQIESEQKFEHIFKAIEKKGIKPKQKIFFDGQIFDAYQFVADLIRSAKSSILIIDNYIDDSVLTHLTKKHKNVEVTIYTKNISKQLKLDAEKFNKQYKNLSLIRFNKSHDRFLIIAQKDIYHFGASLKDLGKKWFAFSKFDKEALDILEKL